jgi:hypothetical protein
MKKIIHPCDVPMYDGKKYPLFCAIEFENGHLSITGVIGPNRWGNAKGGAGQVDMEFDHRNPAHNDTRYSDPIKARDLHFPNGWNVEKWYTFLEIWHDWHLNDLHAECEHQEAAGITYHSDPSNVCEVCGYKIGSAWTSRTIPGEVIEFLLSLPDTDKAPAWV